MANDEHVEMLKRGVAAWNKWRSEDPSEADLKVNRRVAFRAAWNWNEWRSENPSEANRGVALRAAWNKWRSENPNVSGADLSEAFLRWVDLNEANLIKALSEPNLIKANLSEPFGRVALRWADLSGANLIGANLIGANLIGADLSRAVLEGADLSRADLHEADLSRADLTGADLHEADLSRAVLEGAVLEGADLHEADLSRAVLERADLEGADLHGADLSRAVLERADLEGADLHGADLSRAVLEGANLHETNLHGANLIKANLREANLREANLHGANLHETNLHGANLIGANLHEAHLSEANLRGANLVNAVLVGTNLRGADLTGCSVYGVSAWGLILDGAKQQDLIITPENEPEITVDNIEVAQFIYLLLHNEKIRDVIDTIGKKAVLILGRFTDERKAVLDALREELRKRDYLPILFDFEVPATRDITETVSLLARMARFIIADLTDPSSIPKELEAIVPSLAVPVQPLLEGASRPYAMFKDYWKYDWVLPVCRYEGLEELLAALAESVIAPAEAKVKALEERRRMIEAELIKPR